MADHDHGCAGRGGGGVQLAAQDRGHLRHEHVRNMPPPTPVRTPSSIAPSGLSPAASAFSAPETANSARPAASRTSTELRNRSMTGEAEEGDEPRRERDADVAQSLIAGGG